MWSASGGKRNSESAPMSATEDVDARLSTQSCWLRASGRLEAIRLKLLVSESYDLVTARSSCSHPTAVRCSSSSWTVLEGKIAEPERFMRVLVDRGADLNELQLVAVLRVSDRSRWRRFFLRHGAMVAVWGTLDNGLEESVYWAHSDADRFGCAQCTRAQVLSTSALLLALVRTADNESGSSTAIFQPRARAP